MEKNKDIKNVLQKSDLDTIIEVNNKAIELQTETSEQYEEMISLTTTLSNNQEKIDDKIKNIETEIKDINKTLLKIMLIVGTGIISLIAQLISLLFRR